MSGKKIPDCTVRRLSIYLRALAKINNSPFGTISSAKLADLTHLIDVQVRKDLSYFGQFGISGTGYEIDRLKTEISRILGKGKRWKIALVGVGNLGSALLAYPGFRNEDFEITRVFDNDLRKIGKTWEGIPIQDTGELFETVETNNIKIGIIAVPAQSAQEVTDTIINAGIKCILNFAPVALSVPEGINLRNVDLSTELENFSYFLNHVQPTEAIR